jgi:ribosomal protein L12E/L44/L45/RPP1/RPP2
MKEQEEEDDEQEGRHWQVVQQKKIQKDVPATPSPSEFKLYAYLLPLSVSRANIITHFGERVHITGPFPSSGVAQGKAHCWLGCSDKHECERLLKLNNSVMMEHQIRVEHARSKRAAASVEDKQQAVECGAVAHSRVPPAAAAAAAAPAAPAAPAAADDDTSKWFALCDADIGQVQPPNITTHIVFHFQRIPTCRARAPFAKRATVTAATP